MAQAQEFLARLVPRITAVEKVALRSALGRVLGRDVVSAIDVPAHDNSAMDGYALRAADLRADVETVLRGDRLGFRRRTLRRHRRPGTVRAHHDRRGHAGRPRHGRCRRSSSGSRAIASLSPPASSRPATTGAWPARTWRGARSPSPQGASSGPPTSASSPRSGRPRRPCSGACASPSSRPATSCVRSASRSTQAAVYDSNRYTLWSMLRRLGCRGRRSRRGTRRSGAARSGVPCRRARRRRHHHLGRRQRRRGRPHPARDGAARRRAVLAHRHAPGTADGDRPDRRRRAQRDRCSGCPATRSP